MTETMLMETVHPQESHVDATSTVKLGICLTCQIKKIDHPSGRRSCGLRLPALPLDQQRIIEKLYVKMLILGHDLH